MCEIYCTILTSDYPQMQFSCAMISMDTSELYIVSDLTLFTKGYPGLRIGPATDDDLVHVLVVPRECGKRDAQVIVGPRRKCHTSHCFRFLDVLEFVLVGCRQVDSL